MSLILKQEPNNYTPAPEGNHPAVCISVVDLGVQKTEWQGEKKEQHKVLVTWELPYEEAEGDQPVTISKRYTMSMHEKSGLYKDLVSWRGRDFTPQEKGGFDLFNIVGVACFLNVIHQEKEGKTYSNITSIAPLAKGMEKPIPRTPKLTKFSLSASTSKEYEELSDGIKKVIQESLSFFQFQVRTGRADQNNTPMGMHDDYPMTDEIVAF